MHIKITMILLVNNDFRLISTMKIIVGKQNHCYLNMHAKDAASAHKEEENADAGDASGSQALLSKAQNDGKEEMQISVVRENRAAARRENKELRHRLRKQICCAPESARPPGPFAMHLAP